MQYLNKTIATQKAVIADIIGGETHCMFLQVTGQVKHCHIFADLRCMFVMTNMKT